MARGGMELSGVGASLIAAGEGVFRNSFKGMNFGNTGASPTESNFHAGSRLVSGTSLASACISG